MANYFKELNEAFDKKYGFNRVVLGTRRKLTEATTSYDWYENGDNHPFLDLYDSAAEELGVYAEPSIQAGKGAVTLYSNGKDVGWIDYEDERRFMNDLYAKYESGKISEQDAKDAIYSFINQHIDYERINSDEMDDDDLESEDKIVTKNPARGNYSYYDFVKFLEPKFNQYMQESGYESSFSYSSEDFWVYLEEGDIIASILKVPVKNIIKMIRSKKIDIMDKSLKDSQLRQVFDQTITNLIKSESGSNWRLSLDSVDELSLYKREDCSYLNEIYPDKKIKYIQVLHIKFENGSFIDFPSVVLDYRTRDSLFYAVVSQDQQVIYSGDDLMSAYLAVEKNTEIQESYVKSKRRKLIEETEEDWDWYEDGFTSPLYRLYGQAFEEAGFDEHADVQSGMGEVYISKKGDPEGMFVANFEDVNDFMNRIHTSMVKGKLTDEKRIKEIIFQGVLDISRWRDYPDFENANESLKEDTALEADKGKKAPLTSKPQSISSMLLKNKSAIDNADDLNALISAVSAALSSKKDDKKVKEIMAKLNTMPDHAKALTYLYNLILKGDNLGVSGRKKYEDYDDGNDEIDRYQKWVDFDMSRYGKISERTQQMVNKAGYQIIKDDHGDYEVAAGHFE